MFTDFQIYSDYATGKKGPNNEKMVGNQIRMVIQCRTNGL